MNRGLALSAVLHAVGFALVLFGPGPRARTWDPARELPVELVRSLPDLPAPKETPRETPRVDPEPPVTERLETPPEPPEEAEEPPKAETPPEPPPAVVPKTKPKPPPRTFQRVAPKRAPEEPSLAERLQERLQETPLPDAPAETPPDAPPPAPAPTTKATAEIEAADFPYAWYLNTLRQKIADSWDPPADRMIGGGANRVVVRFRVHRDGLVTGLTVEGASGTPGLDASARRAVERAMPFPPLPDAWEGPHLDVAVRFTAAGGTG